MSHLFKICAVCKFSYFRLWYLKSNTAKLLHVTQPWFKKYLLHWCQGFLFVIYTFLILYLTDLLYIDVCLHKTIPLLHVTIYEEL